MWSIFPVFWVLAIFPDPDIVFFTNLQALLTVLAAVNYDAKFGQRPMFDLIHEMDLTELTFLMIQ